MTTETLQLTRRLADIRAMSATRARMSVGLLVAASAVVRAAVAWQHPIPRYFPDEYIYTALARSIAHGQLSIRGATVVFPAILEPVLAAPIWGGFGPVTAHHLVQTENAIVASLAAVPVYVLARRLRLSEAYAFGCALYTLLTPSLVLIAYTQTDAIGYTVALAAVAAGVLALEEPTRKRQLLFVLFATLACATRVEYFVIVAAYAVGALVLDRRTVLRRHMLALLATAPAVAVVLLGAFGYYLTEPGTRHLSLGAVKWLFLQPFLLALVAGVVIVPGAIAGTLFVRRDSRTEKSFALLSASFAVLLVGEASKVAYETSQFKERYLFALFPLVALAFGLYLRNGRPGRWVVIGTSAAIVVAAARLPLAPYATSVYKTSSQFLFAVYDFGSYIGLANASLVAAIAATVLAVWAVAIIRFGGGGLALLVSIVITAVVGIDASHVDISRTRAMRSVYSPDLTWVDDAHVGPVTAIETPPSPPRALIVELYWNSSIQHEAVMQNAVPTDYFKVLPLHIEANGLMPGIGKSLLVDDYGTTMTFANAVRKEHERFFTLWRASSTPRLRTLIVGRFDDAWLSGKGRIRFWPKTQGAAGVAASFRLSLPRGYAKVVRLHIGKSSILVRAGSHADVTCRAAGAFDEPYEASDFTLDESLIIRSISVKLTRLRPVDLGTAPQSGSGTCSIVPS